MSVEIGVSNLDRSMEFYHGLLGLPEDGRVRLVEIAAGAPSTWEADNLQRGIRHFGMKVADTDAWAARLKAAGVEFALEPFDAFGDVRIAFFFDPDGAYLELVQGYVRHNNLWSAELAQEEIDGDRGWDGSPRFDHIAITVPDLDEALEFYTGLGFGAVGQLVRPEDELGFLITNLRGGAGTLEIFSFAQPTRAPADQGADGRGLRAIGVHGPDTDLTGPGGVTLRVSPSGAPQE
jgi:catechol 2,3-dioxygenase-like lactoylglutathione lyase family enzyme